MLDESRIGIYDFVYDLFKSVVTESIYMVEVPQSLSASDIKDGFLVVRLGNVVDYSEFPSMAYGMARVSVETYVPPKSRGRMDYDKCKALENKVNAVIRDAIERGDMGGYSVSSDGILSVDAVQTSNSDNIFYMSIRSFRVLIDKE